ncbi:MAG: YbaN family protein [Xanthomonadales bacterium]|nr:YbaN family protein [Xanthomonadales bacterium]MDH3923702.1 YbaN family protein [Xanthomonadales bacterium]MDH3939454.1 YbaN family protein [Xanthomonadales bacterium]MDH3999792.1 YbaN family protein [Xanthomonadales bacterium]
MNLFRWFGFVFLGLGTLGIVLPLLPTTPFVLLSAACFARSSERWHRWLLANETFGPMIRNWEEHRCISCRVKIISILTMVLVGGYSVLFAVEHVGLKIAGGVLLLIGFSFILLIRTCNGKTG